MHGGVRMVSPYLGRKDADWYRNTADAVYQNINELHNTQADTIVILGGDHIYKMDYRPMINLLWEKQADVVIGVMRIPIEEAHRFGIVAADDDNRITSFEEKPKQPKSNLVSMGIYVFNKEVLIDRLIKDAADPNSKRDFGGNIVPKMIEQGDKVFAYHFDDYWRDVGTIQSYWEANMELLQSPPAVDLYERNWVIYTKSEERPSAYIAPEASVENSLISHGCQIHGKVSHSVLSPGVVIEEGAVVRDSIIMFDTVIGKNAVIDRAVIDKEVVIGANCTVGYGDDNTPNQQEPQRLNTGITVVGKKARVRDGVRIGRNCKIGIDVQPEDFPANEIASGESVLVPVDRVPAWQQAQAV
jgi:glucose-1-phosphate adenylyltransferase